MPSEHEVERMVVRLVGDNKGYADVMKDSAKLTGESMGKIKDEADKAEKSLNDKLAGGVKTAADKIKGSMGAVGTATELMKGKFDSLGDAANKVGSVMGSLPFVWAGVAAGVVAAGAAIINWFTGPLRKVQEGAREGFLSVASGARTIAQATRDIELRTIQQGIERALSQIETMEQGASVVNTAAQHGANTLVTLFTVFNRTVRGQPGPTQDQTAEATMNEAAGLAERRIDMFQNRMRNPRLRAALTRAAVIDVGGQIQDRPVEMRERIAERTMMRAMTSPTMAPEVAERSLMASVRQAAIDDLRRRLGRENVTEAQAELMLRGQIARAQQESLQTMRVIRAEQLGVELEQKADDFRKSLIEMSDTYQRFRVVQAGASDHEIRAMELEQTLQRELNELRRRGASELQVLQATARGQSLNLWTRMNEAIQEGNQVMAQGRLPAENYNRELERLDRLLRAGAVSERTYNRALEAAGDAFRSAFSEARGIVTRFQHPLTGVASQLQVLDTALDRGGVSVLEHERSVAGLSREYEGLNAAMGNTPGVATRSAEALGRIEAQRERLFRTPRSIRERLAGTGRNVTPLMEPDALTTVAGPPEPEPFVPPPASPVQIPLEETAAGIVGLLLRPRPLVGISRDPTRGGGPQGLELAIANLATIMTTAATHLGTIAARPPVELVGADVGEGVP